MSSTNKSPYEIVIRPIVTEKSVGRSEESKFTFAVHSDANKYEIAWAVEQIQKEAKNAINVIAVNTITVRGKARRGRFFRRANQGRSSDWKKAIVTLAPGQQIEILEGV